MPSYLNNQTLHLRAIEPEDLEKLYEWENDTDVWKYGSAMSPYSKYVLRQYIANAQTDIFESKQLRFMIALQNEQVAIGTIDLYDFDALNSRCGVGIYIAPEYRKRGFALQALSLLQDYTFCFLNINQLYAVIPESNIGSIQLFQKSGYHTSGVLQEWILFENKYENAIMVQKLKSKQ